MTKLKGILKSLLQEFGSIDTNNGTLDFEGTLEVGTEVTINDEVAPDGEYETDDKVIVVAEGKVTEIRDKDEVIEEEPAEFAKFKKVAQAYSESYEEKEAKIYDAIRALGIEYPYIIEAGDEYAIVDVWTEDGERYYKYFLSWDEEGNVIVVESEEVEHTFVPVEDEKPEGSEVEMEEQEPASEEPSTEEPVSEDERDYGKEIDELKADIEAIKATVNELKNEPANTPISESFQAIVENKPTGNAKFDKALKRFSYLNK